MANAATDPVADPARLEALRSTGLLDSAPEAVFDRHVRIAARLLGTPVALVSLVDADRQFFKAAIGLPEPWASRRQTPLSHSFCRIVVQTGEPLVVENAEFDPRVCENGAFQEIGVVAYLGVPLRDASGAVLGSFCVIDVRPRVWEPADRSILADLAEAVTTELILRREKTDAARLNAKYEAILDAATEVAVVATDVSGTIVVFNRGAERLLGYAREDVVGRTTPADFLDSPETASEPVRRWCGLEASAEPTPPAAGGLAPVEVFFVRKDGARRRFSVRISAIDDGGGGGLAVGRDVTDLMTAERDARKFAALVENSGDFIAMADLDTLVTYVNPAGRRLVGFRDQLSDHPRHIHDFLDEDTVRIAREEAIPQVLATGQWLGEGKLRHFVTGEPIPVAINLFLVREPVTGQPLCLATILRDSTEDERAKARVLEGKARLRAILEASLDALITIDHEGVVVEFNPSAERIFGFRRENAVGRSLSELIVPPIYREAHRRGLRHFLATGEGPVLGKRIEIEAVRADGSSFPIELAISLIQRDGPPVFTAFLRDISERKKVESELRRAKEEADAASRSKSEFLANMSHEVRTPMAAVLGNADMLLDPNLSQAERDNALQAIRRNGSHLLQLISDILDLSKIEAGKMELDLAAHSPWQSVLEVVSSLRVRADERGVDLRVEATGLMPSLALIDAMRLRQILMNLISNAIKFSAEGGRVLVRGRGTPMGADWRPEIRFEIEDQGIGMTTDQLTLLFRPFQQVDNSASRRFGGSGLGLSITKRLVEAMGGAITVESRPGRGSRFEVRLPVALPTDAAWIEPETLAAPPPANDSPLGRKLAGSVLLAEDSPDNQRVLVYHLKRMGLNVEVVDNGAQAVERATREGVDLILMDLQMPVLDGYGATSSLRRAGFDRPIVALTAHALKEDRDRCLRAGFSDYLTKPVDVAVLTEALARHLAKGARPALATTPPILSDMASDPDFEPLLQTYVESLAHSVEKMRSALREGDFKTIQSAAHQVKGSGAMYGYPILTEIAARIESACRAGLGSEAAARLLDQFAESADRIVAGLEVRKSGETLPSA